jgi:cyclophilin family peptidyl-prolyl cis-trans isomerase/protein-disulfide isomerase
MRPRSLLALSVVVVALLAAGVVVASGGLELWPRRMACTLSERGVLPDSPSPFPPAAPDDWSWGPEDAPVTLIAYAGFQCPHCAELAAALSELRAAYPDDLRLVYRHLPLATLHDKAELAARAAQAAGAQGQFWPMHDRLFEEQEVWAAAQPDLFQQWLVEQARDLGLDAGRFAADLDSPETVAAVRQDYDEAVGMGLSGTPSLAINGHYYEGPMDAWTLGAYVELIQLEERQFDECPPLQTRNRRQYRATLHTTQGDIVIELLPEQAPLAVNNFLFLARQGWYDGVPFHRVIPGFVTQTGDPSGTGLGGPGYTFADEIVAGAAFDRPGVVAMAHPAPDQNGSQFFITYAARPELDGKHTIFGQVVAGMDVAEALTVRDPATDATGLPPADQILSIEIVEE